MAPKISSSSDVPSIASTSPRTSPQLASLPVTDVLNPQTLRGAEKSSDNAMQTHQRQQTQKVPTSAPLSSSRVNTSVADDLDDILNSAFEDFDQAGKGAEAILASTPIEIETSDILDFRQMQEVLLQIVSIAIMPPADIPHDFEAELVNFGEKIDAILDWLDIFFLELLEQKTSLQAWIEKKSKASNFCHPFGASHFLSVHLGKTTCLTPYVTQNLITQWQQSYPRCVLLLKQNGLDAFNETEFPFDEQGKQTLMFVEMFSSGPAKEMLENFNKNPDFLTQQIEAMNANPALMSEFERTMGEAFGTNPEMSASFKKEMEEFKANPEILKQRIEAIRANPELLRQQFENLRAGTTPFQNQMVDPALAPFQKFASFFDELDQELRQHPQDRDAIDAWLKARVSKAGYDSPFYLSDGLVNNPTMEDFPAEQQIPIFLKFKTTFLSCCRQLKALNLQHYLQEGPSSIFIAELKKVAPQYEKIVTKYLSIFRHLFTVLQFVANGSKKAQQDAVESLFVSFKEEPDFTSPFMLSGALYCQRDALKEVLDPKLVDEFNKLFLFCLNRLKELELKHLIYEDSPEKTLTVSTPKKEMTITKRFEKESEFFRSLILQEDKNVDQWLKENSPKNDYPLLWGKKRLFFLGDYRETIGIDLRREWRTRYETCVEKLSTDALRHHLNLELISADASPELRAFLQN